MEAVYKNNINTDVVTIHILKVMKTKYNVLHIN